MIPAVTANPLPLRPVSILLQEFIDAHPEPDIQVSTLVAAFGERGLALLLLVFALICAVPIPLPGIHMLLSLPLFYIGGHYVAGRTALWLPRQVLNYKLPRAAFTEISLKALPWIAKTERFSRRRFAFFTQGLFYRFFGVMVLFISSVLWLPLLLTNFVPSVAIALMALGMLTKDGLEILGGMILGILWGLFLYFIYIGLLIALFHETAAFFSR